MTKEPHMAFKPENVPADDEITSAPVIAVDVEDEE